MVIWEAGGSVPPAVRSLVNLERFVGTITVTILKATDFFTSDQHYGHKNVIKYCRRPFAANMDDATVEEVNKMNEHMVQAYNDTVAGGRAFHIGDFSLALGWVDKYGPRLIGEKFLVPGNHDWCHPMHSKKAQKMARAVARFTDAGFKMLDIQEDMVYDSFKIKVCHLPYWIETADAEYEGRFKEWRPRIGNEDILICGHVHNAWKMRRMTDGTMMYNVGVDVHGFKPISIEEIVKDVKEYNEEDKS